MIPLYENYNLPFQSAPFSVDQSHTEQYPAPMATCHASPPMPTSYDLQGVLDQYQSQPDLLCLILQSKVEEDRRKAEEAKVRARELSLMLAQQRQRETRPIHEHNAYSTVPSVVMSASSSSNVSGYSVSSGESAAPLGHLSMAPSTSHTSTDYIFQEEYNMSSDINAVFHSPPPLLSHAASPQHRQGSPVDSSLASTAAPAEELDDHFFSPVPINGGSQSTPMLNMNIDSSNTSVQPNPTYLPYVSNASNPFSGSPSHSTPLQPTPRVPSSSLHVRADSSYIQRPRRRREILPISRIVQTRDFPYIDGYFWKNNGNTVQKKTGNKSVYYKCSNSIKGCPVNKTVTKKENGEYLIKYRGEHLVDCNKFQTVIDM